jgi:hypothetical protein
MTSLLDAINESTPVEITDEIRSFARTLGRGELKYVPIQPSPTAQKQMCVSAVDDFVAAKGGKRIMGWKIWEGHYWIKAVYHAVWETPEGQLIDVTPEAGETETLFIGDPTERPSAYVFSRAVPKKSRFKHVVEAILAVDRLQMEIHKRINNGGTKSLSGVMLPHEAAAMARAQLTFAARLAEKVKP